MARSLGDLKGKMNVLCVSRAFLFVFCHLHFYFFSEDRSTRTCHGAGRTRRSRRPARGSANTGAPRPGGSRTHMFPCAALIAVAARPMSCSTPAAMCVFSRASRWNSTADSVPSIWASRFSSVFFLLSASSAATGGEATFERRAHPSRETRLAPARDSPLARTHEGTRWGADSGASSPSGPPQDHTLGLFNVLLFFRRPGTRQRTKVHLHVP